MIICRLCGNKNLELYYTQGNNGEFNFYKCKVCKLVNLDLIGELDQKKYEKKNQDPRGKRRKKFRKGKIQSYAFIKKHIHRRGRLLDIGFGGGGLLNLAHLDGWTIKGIELSPVFVQSAKERYNFDVVTADFMEYKITDGEQYDTVVLRHVLEHLEQPVKAMNKVHSLLVPGGYAVLEFPNIESLEQRFKRFFQRTGLHKKKYSENYKPGHCNEFCKESFTFLINKTGYDILVWQTYSSSPTFNFIYNHVHIGNKTRTIIRKR
ncbi:class I SAM-dependent methyltransferase [Candidatus Latescibacterota bacterium]